MKKNLFVLALLLLVDCSQQETLPKEEDDHNSDLEMDVFIPTRESIIENGRYLSGWIVFFIIFIPLFIGMLS